MTEATTSVPWELCEAVVRALTFPCDLMRLKDIVLQIIDRVGGKRESVYGLKVATQCFRYELLELIRSDGTKMQFPKDCEYPIICAAPINPAEAVWIEPREDGPHFVRRPATPPAPPAEPPQSSTTATLPVDRQLPAAGGPDPSQSRQPRQPSPATQSKRKPKRKLKRKLKRKPRRKAGVADVPVQGTQVKLGGPQLPGGSEPGARAKEPPPRPPDGASEIEHVIWAVRSLRITDSDKLAGLRGKKLQKLVCNTVGPKFWCNLRTVQRGKKRADSM